MSAESAHLSTFGAETETEAEIRSTSTHVYIEHITMNAIWLGSIAQAIHVLTRFLTNIVINYNKEYE